MHYEDARDNELFQFAKSFKIPHISMATIWLGKDERRECISHCQLARRNEVLQFAKFQMVGNLGHVLNWKSKLMVVNISTGWKCYLVNGSILDGMSK